MDSHSCDDCRGQPSENRTAAGHLRFVTGVGTVLEPHRRAYDPDPAKRHAGARRGRPVRLPDGSAVIGSAGATAWANRSRRTGWRLAPGTRGRVSHEGPNRGFVRFTFGSGAPWCHLPLDRCRASHVHTALVKAAEVDPWAG